MINIRMWTSVVVVVVVAVVAAAADKNDTFRCGVNCSKTQFVILDLVF